MKHKLVKFAVLTGSIVAALAADAATPAPTLTFTRTPSPMVAGEDHHFQWSTTNATSLYVDCTTQGTGFVTRGHLALSGDHYSATNAAWVGNPSQCAYTVTGPGGSRTYYETLETIKKASGGGGGVSADMGSPPVYLHWREPVHSWSSLLYRHRSMVAATVNVTKKDGALVSIKFTETLTDEPAGFPFCVQAYASGAWTEKQCLIPTLRGSITVGSPLAEPIYGLRFSAASPNLANYGAVIAASATDTKGNSSGKQWSRPG
ncbi:MAG: hypothetical protein LBF50_06385, partial [Azoarcus sp.]|nr:hypothetical protein [Azoarcus sp.]